MKKHLLKLMVLVALPTVICLQGMASADYLYTQPGMKMACMGLRPQPKSGI